MPPEHQNKADELLKRYAKERRAQSGDPTLHPATRRLLQGEVARQFAGKKERQRLAGVWAIFWRQRILVGATAVALAYVTVLMLSRPEKLTSSQFELALLDGAVKEQPTSVTVANAPRPSDAKGLAKGEAGSKETRSEVRQASISPVSPTTESKLLADQDEKKDSTAMLDSVNRFAFSPSVAVSPSLNYYSDFVQSQTNDSDYIASLSPALNFPSKAEDNTLGALRESQPESRGFAAPQSRATRLAEAAVSANKKGDDQFFRSRREAGAPAGAKESAATTTPSLNQADNLASAPNAPARPASADIGRASTPPAGNLAPRAVQNVERISGDELRPTSSQDQLGAFPSARSNAGIVSRFRRLTLTSTALGDKEVASKAKAAASEASPVLNQFAVEQSGSTIRLIDADGSHYVGELETPLSTAFGVSLAGQPLAERKQGPQLSEGVSKSDEYSFRASGSNATLRQMVVITGKFAGNTNAVLAGGRNTYADPAKPLAPSVARSLPSSVTVTGPNERLNRSLAIEGTVRIGGTNLQWFRAAQVE